MCNVHCAWKFWKRNGKLTAWLPLSSIWDMVMIIYCWVSISWLQIFSPSSLSCVDATDAQWQRIYNEVKSKVNYLCSTIMWYKRGVYIAAAVPTHKTTTDTGHTKQAMVVCVVIGKTIISSYHQSCTPVEHYHLIYLVSVKRLWKQYAAEEKHIPSHPQMKLIFIFKQLFSSPPLSTVLYEHTSHTHTRTPCDIAKMKLRSFDRRAHTSETK